MRVEKQIKNKHSRDRRHKEHEDKKEASQFADNVLEIYRLSFDGPISGEANTSEERLAAILAFMRTQCLEYLRTARFYPEYQTVDNPRIRVALAAAQMFWDIAADRRHDIHTFFRGLNDGSIPGREQTSRDGFRNCVLVACVVALQQAIDSKPNLSAASAIKLMRENTDIAQFMPPQNKALEMTVSRYLGRDADEIIRKEVTRHLNEFIAVQSTTQERILRSAFEKISIWENPLDFQAATAVDFRMLIARDAAGNPQVLAPKALAISSSDRVTPDAASAQKNVA